MLVADHLPVVLAAYPAPSREESKAAADAFREGCIGGSLQLPASRGAVLKEGRIPEFADVLEAGRPVLSRTVIKFKFPSDTYLVFAEFTHLQPKSIAKVCTMVSHKITTADASAIMMQAEEGHQPITTWWPNMYFPEWTLDRPDRGYRKRMYIRSDSSVLLEVGTYADLAKINSPIPTEPR